MAHKTGGFSDGDIARYLRDIAHGFGAVDSRPDYSLQVSVAPELDVAAWQASRLAIEMPYFTPDADEEFGTLFADLLLFAATDQRHYGLEPVDLSFADVHIVAPDDMQRLHDLLGATAEQGTYDPTTGVIYFAEPQVRDIRSMTRAAYIFAHELGHRLTSGSSRLYGRSRATILQEGLADKFARNFIHRVYLPRHAPDLLDQISDAFACGRSPCYIDDLSVWPTELLSVDPSTNQVVSMNHIVEARVVYELEELLGQQIFEELMRRASGGDGQLVQQLIVDALGEQVCDLVASDPARTPPLDVLRRLQNL